jgi:predicted cupin superfamily sugar epimerase
VIGLNRMNAEAEKIIARLGLVPLPNEGGFFRQSWVSRERLADGRAAGSAIYFLLTPEGFSALHQLKTDELWHFYAGDPVEHLQLDPRDRSTRSTVLGPDVFASQTTQLIVRGGIWQGARLVLGEVEGLTLSPAEGLAPAAGRGWALLGCTLAPAWDEREFLLGQRAELSTAFPAQASLIAALTR